MQPSQRFPWQIQLINKLFRDSCSVKTQRILFRQSFSLQCKLGWPTDPVSRDTSSLNRFHPLPLLAHLILSLRMISELALNIDSILDHVIHIQLVQLPRLVIEDILYALHKIRHFLSKGSSIGYRRSGCKKTRSWNRIRSRNEARWGLELMASSIVSQRHSRYFPGDGSMSDITS